MRRVTGRKATGNVAAVGSENAESQLCAWGVCFLKMILGSSDIIIIACHNDTDSVLIILKNTTAYIA
jgi:hypothetical protein